MSRKYESTFIDGIPFIKIPVMVKDLCDDVAAVYAIKWADLQRYEYVGQSSCVKSRLINHEHGFLNCRFELLEVIDVVHYYDRLDAEDTWITKLILEGHDLVNNCHVAKKARTMLELA